jgi:hypothetical protein
MMNFDWLGVPAIWPAEKDPYSPDPVHTGGGKLIADAFAASALETS